MTDAQILQNLLAVYERMVTFDSYNQNLPAVKEVIAALHRRIELEGSNV